MKVEILEQVDEDWWNELLCKSPHANIFQTAQWGDWLRYVFLAKVKYLISYDDKGEICAQGILTSKSPYSSLWSGKTFLYPFARLCKFIYPEVNWLHGPVLHCSSDKWNVVLSNYFRTVKSLSKWGGVYSGTMPYGVVNKVNTEELVGKKHSSWGTFLVDLTIPTEEIWKNLKSSARKNLRKFDSSGIEVRIVDNLDDLSELYGELCKWTRRVGGRIYDWRYWEARFYLLNKIKAERYYVAFKNGEPIGCLGVWQYGPIAFEFGSLQSLESLREKTNCQDYIKWHIFKSEKDRGVNYFDLSGVNPLPKSKKEKNIYQYKKKWGGNYLEYPIIQSF